MVVAMIDTPLVLLVEDNPLDVRLLQEICREAANFSIQFDYATSLTEASDKIATTQHHAILLDLGMPESVGMETLQQLLAYQAKYNHHGAVIVLTSVNSDDLGEEAITMGAQDFLVKGSFDGKQIQRSIRYACERQRLHQQQTEANARISLMATALDQASDSIIITNNKGMICYVNQAFIKATGYQPDEVIGHNPSMLNSGKQNPSFYRRMWHTINSGKQWDAEIIDRRKNGELFPCRLEIAPVKNSHGSITHFIGIQRDLTEHKLLENQLRQSQKMEAIGTLTGGIAHDFNNMLAGIVGNIYLAKRHTDEPEKLRKRLESIEQTCDRASDMIKKMMAFGRNDMIQITSMNLTPLIEDIFRMEIGLLPEDILLHLDICEQPLTITGDATQLHQILLNLVNNARDAVAEMGSKATITCSLHPYTPDQAFLQLHPDAEGKTFAHLTVQDNGCGVDATTLQHLTEPFFTTKEVGSGTGLGLSMIEGAVAQHHGILTITSAPKEGMSVEIYLPLTEAENSPKEIENNHNMVAGNGETILVADDEHAVREVLRETLSIMGYQVIVAEDGAQALTLFRQHQQQISLVLLDVVMPQMGGIESYRHMQQVFHNLPVIFISGYERTRIPSELLAGTHQTSLHKPFHPPHLSRIIHSMLK